MLVHERAPRCVQDGGHRTERDGRKGLLDTFRDVADGNGNSQERFVPRLAGVGIPHRVEHAVKNAVDDFQIANSVGDNFRDATLFRHSKVPRAERSREHDHNSHLSNKMNRCMAFAHDSHPGERFQYRVSYRRACVDRSNATYSAVAA